MFHPFNVNLNFGNRFQPKFSISLSIGKLNIIPDVYQNAICNYSSYPYIYETLDMNVADKAND